jgi:hypothetical protein
VLPSKLANLGKMVYFLHVYGFLYMFLLISKKKTSLGNQASVARCECCRHPAPMAAASRLMAASRRASHKAAVVKALEGGILGPTTPPGEGWEDPIEKIGGCERVKGWRKPNDASQKKTYEYETIGKHWENVW